MPFMAMVPPAGNTFYVPIDDTHTKLVGVSFNPSRALSPDLIWSIVHGGDTAAFKDGHYEGFPENRWRQNRSTMGKSFSGVTGLLCEDLAVWLSMGPIYDRSKEHLVPADRAVHSMRRLLLQAADDVEGGKDPRGVAPQDTMHISSSDGVVPAGSAWQGLVPQHVALER
jgi:hypothetical protein